VCEVGASIQPKKSMQTSIRKNANHTFGSEKTVVKPFFNFLRLPVLSGLFESEVMSPWTS